MRFNVISFNAVPSMFEKERQNIMIVIIFVNFFYSFEILEGFFEVVPDTGD